MPHSCSATGRVSWLIIFQSLASFPRSINTKYRLERKKASFCCALVLVPPLPYSGVNA